MKKIIMLAVLGVIGVSCTNAKLVQYNTDRLDTIESYLSENKFMKQSDKLDELQKSGEIEYSKQYKSLEREADAWQESQK